MTPTEFRMYLAGMVAGQLASVGFDVLPVDVAGTTMPACDVIHHGQTYRVTVEVVPA